MDYIRYYETFIPRSFVLDNGEHVELEASEIGERIAREPLFLLYVSPEFIEDIRSELLVKGFSVPSIGAPKGERYSLARVIDAPWEMHVRIYGDGFIEGEIEVSRGYLEHLGDYRVYVVYEPFNYYSRAYNRLHILYRPSRRWVVRVYDHVRVRIRPPKTLTPWKPIAVFAGFFAAIGILSWALDRLERGDRGGGRSEKSI